jgi:hypothetical protein
MEYHLEALSDCGSSECIPDSTEEWPGVAINDALIDRDTLKELIAAEERTRYGDLMVLPHESEDEFKILQKELSRELSGHRLGFGCQIAHEAAMSRLSINRYRLAVSANADRGLNAGGDGLPALVPLRQMH